MNVRLNDLTLLQFIAAVGCGIALFAAAFFTAGSLLNSGAWASAVALIVCAAVLAAATFLRRFAARGG